MKAAKIIVFAVLGLVVTALATFLLIGYLNPTVHYENSVMVNKPVEYAWRVFSNPENMDQWLAGLQNLENLEGEPMTPGSRYRLTFDVEGETVVVTETVQEVKQGELFSFLLDSDALSSENKILFTALDSASTRIDAISIVDGKGIFWDAILAVSVNMMRNEAQKSYNNLKKLIESNPAMEMDEK